MKTLPNKNRQVARQAKVRTIAIKSYTDFGTIDYLESSLNFKHGLLEGINSFCKVNFCRTIPGLFFVVSNKFAEKEVYGNHTRVMAVEGERADHLTTTTSTANLLTHFKCIAVVNKATT